MSALPDTPRDGQIEALERERQLPVPAAPATRVLEPLAPAAVSPAVLAATGGFLAGVGTLLLMRLLRRPGRRAPLGRRPRPRRGAPLEIAGTRSFLVDVHLLRR